MSEDSKPTPSNNGEGGKNRNRNRNRNRRRNNSKRGPRPEGQEGSAPTAHGEGKDGQPKQGRQPGQGRRRGPKNGNGGGNRNKQGGNRPKGENQGRQSGGGRRRGPKPAPKLTFFQKILKMLGLYTPPEPPKRNRNNNDRKPRREKLTIEGDQKVRRSEKSHAPKEKNEPPRKRRPKRTKVEPGSVKNGRLYIGNLSYDAAEHDLEELFKGVGTVRRVEVVYNRHTHRSKGYGFITMATADEAQRAIEVLHDQYYLGRRMVINVAKEKSEYETPDKPLAEQKPELDENGNTPESTAPTAAPSMAAVAAAKVKAEAEEQAAIEAAAKAKAEAEAAATAPTPAVEETPAPQSEEAPAEDNTSSTQTEADTEAPTSEDQAEEPKTDA